MVSSLSRVLLTSQVFTSGYVNTETILHFFYKITNERGTKTVFTYAHVKWFYGQSERTYYLNYFIILNQTLRSGYVNMETILHFFYKITNERGTKTVFTYAHVKWFYGQSEHAYYLNYFIKLYLSFV